MNVTVAGAGRIGLVIAASLADRGHPVVCVDADVHRIATLQAGRVPAFEPGLDALVRRAAHAGRLTFSSDFALAAAHAALQFIAMGTPGDDDGRADVRHVLAAARQVGRHMRAFTVVVAKSTVPVGTCAQMAAVIREELAARFPAGAAPRFTVVANPEFLREGVAVEDFAQPDRIILGVEAGPDGEEGLALLRDLYAPFERGRERTLVMDVRSAELAKYAANAMLAARISFMNELANLAERVGADIEQVRRGIGSDPRIGASYLQAGTGYGGSCFPKDVRALIRTAESHGAHPRMLQAVEAVNEAQKHVLVDKLLARLGPGLAGRSIAVWGLAFKPDTDDMREAPSRVIVAALLRAGARVVAHDPVAAQEARRVLEADLGDDPALLARFALAEEPMEAAAGADALVVVTEWKMYRSPSWNALRSQMKTAIVLDGRNLYDPAQVQAAGLEYHGIGRRPAAAPGAAR